MIESLRASGAGGPGRAGSPARARTLAAGLLALTIPALDPGLAARAAQPDGRARVMLQTFGWNVQQGGTGNWYDLLAARASELREAGFTTLWFPPPCKDRTGAGGNGYFPSDFYDLGDLDQFGSVETRFGSLDELKEAIRALHAQDLEILGDLVVNHRAATHQDDQGRWTVYDPASGRMVWQAWANPHFSDCEDTGAHFGTDDICHADPRVMEDLVAWITWLQREVGYDGWRIDFAKGFAPWVARRLLDATGQPFSVAEYWTTMRYEQGRPAHDQDAHRQEIVDWIDGTEGLAWAFDFTTKGILQEAVGGELWRLRAGDGRAPGVLGWWPGRAVTFLDNHDTGSQQAHWPFPGAHLALGYSYILTHPGIPCVFWEHFQDGALRPVIADLIAARRAARIHSESPLQILEARGDLYVARVGPPDRGLWVRLGTGSWSPPGPAVVRVQGARFTVWIRGGS